MSFMDKFYGTFIEDDRYQLFLTGLGHTLLIALIATIIGVVIGVLIAVCRVQHAQTGKLTILDLICRAYVAVVRGTPVVVQLMIMYYLILVNVNSAVLVGSIAFGINSGAYVSEIVRAGINAIDPGQMEAGRSLGLSRAATMRHIILPQAIKNILPALGNEFIALLKETSVAGYVGIVDLTKASDIVRSRTFDPFFSLIAVAIIYFILVFGMSAILKHFEKRLAKSDRS